MPLPIKPLPVETLEIAGTVIEYQALTRAQAIRLDAAAGDFRGRPLDAEIFILASGTRATEEDARRFHDTTDAETVGELIDAILILSGLAVRRPDGSVITKDQALRERNSATARAALDEDDSPNPSSTP